MKNLFFFVLLLSHSAYPVIYKLGPTKSNPGLFSIFFTVLGVLDLYDRAMDDCTGLTIDFENVGLYYDPAVGSNWWNYYFEPIRIGQGLQEKIFPQERHAPLSLFAAYTMSSERGGQLIREYIRLKPSLQNKIDLFLENNFKNYDVIGIHYRGTDKVVAEAPVVKYDVLIDLMNKELAINKDIKIFVATDEEHFLQCMREKFPGKIIAIETYRSSDKKPVHTSNALSPYQKGEHAIIDCLLLAQCKKLYRTSSNLSAASTRFNPSLEVILLSKSMFE